jgi:phenylalanyl-tRNA synthetase beta chain
MIVTRNWLQEFIDISKISTIDICSALNSIGLEVDSYEKIFIPNDIVVGNVIECIKHPDAKRLNICQVDIGKEIVQIVCGASNVAVGQFVPVAIVGANLGNDFIIKEINLKGIDSNGMICSSAEIGLATLNDGILELDESIGKLVLGKDLNEYPALDFEIIEIELTANRGDCLSINGIARELSTYFNILFHKQELELKSNNIGIGRILNINCNPNIESNLVFKVANIKEFNLPLLYNLRAGIVGIYKNTQIETAVAYSTHATGVLLNVYTKAITTSNKKNLISLNIKKDNNGFDTVNGEIILSTIGIKAGHILKEDKIVILEAAYLNPENLSQKVFNTKKNTCDVYYKSSRGSEPNLVLGIDYLTHMISCFGATIYNGNEQFGNDIKAINIAVKISKINAIIGENIPKEKIINILSSLEFNVKNSGEDSLDIIIPTFRHDIKNIADITEEIVRIIGIDNIKAKPLAIDEVNRINNTSRALRLKNIIRTKAISNGFFETVTYLFSQREQLQQYGFNIVEENQDILNPITNELNTFRTSLALNLVNAVSLNVKQGFKSIALFENGVIFDKHRDESKSLGFIFSGEKELEAIQNSGKPDSIDLFEFSQKISNCIGEFELETMITITDNFIHPYQNATIIQDGKNIGCIYKLHPSAAKDFDISNNTFIALINFDNLQDNLIQASDISKFQSSKRDLSIIVPKNMEYKKIKDILNNLNIKEIKQFNLIDIYSDEELDQNESLTIKFILQSDEKTLEENEIVTIIDNILEALNTKLTIGLR